MHDKSCKTLMFTLSIPTSLWTIISVMAHAKFVLMLLLEEDLFNVYWYYISYAYMVDHIIKENSYVLDHKKKRESLMTTIKNF